MSNPGGRIHGLDVLRGVAMTAGVFLHGAIAYKQGYHFGDWVFDKSFTSWFFDWLYMWINSFRMQLFFLLAGFFARLLIVRNGYVAFGINRLKRIGLPLVVCYFTILPLTLVPFLYNMYEVQGNDPWPMLADFFSKFFTLRGAYGFMHLWFLQHLLVYCGIAVVIVFLVTRFTSIQLNGKGMLNVGPLRFLLMVVPVLFAITVMYSTPIPAIWTGFRIPTAQFLYYGFFFLLGWILENNRETFSLFSSRSKLFLIIGTIVSVASLYYLNTTVFNKATGEFMHPYSSEVLGLKLVFSFQTMLLAMGSIGLFSSLFNNPSPFWKYIADSAYWIYLIHLPLVFTAQLLLVHSGVPGILRFPIVIVATLLLAFLSYEYLVRYSWVGTMLNGKRDKG